MSSQCAFYEWSIPRPCASHLVDGLEGAEGQDLEGQAGDALLGRVPEENGRIRDVDRALWMQ